MREITSHQVAGAETNLTIQVEDEAGSGGAHHRYAISGLDTSTNGSELCGSRTSILTILFQNGPVPTYGVNGVTVESLIALGIDRMECFQAGPFACADNQEALEHLQKAMAALKRRTEARVARGVEGKEVL